MRASREQGPSAVAEGRPVADEAVTAEAGSESVAASPVAKPGNTLVRRMARFGGPILIVISVLFAMRGFVFADRITNQHPDILGFWLPHYCFLGKSLAAGHIPLWNPLQMAGMPFASDPQSGWLYVPAMALFAALPCGGAIRAVLVLQPMLAGLGLYWFLRKEQLHRVAATAGGLSLAMLMSTSVVGLSLPFAGTLAWTPLVLVGASGYVSATRLSARLAWLALAAFAWGQVAAAHMSHGLVMASVAAAAYVVARCARDVRAGRTPRQTAALLAVGFLAVLPLANLATFLPRLAVVDKTSLRFGYEAIGGHAAAAAGVRDRSLATSGVWSGWPLALGSAPGAYVGATILISVPLALRAFGKRYLVAAFAAIGLFSYVLTLDVVVRASWFRALVLHVPFGDIYLHNPGRFRYLMLLAVPALGALGIQSLIDAPPRRPGLWLGAGVALFLAIPLVLGAHPVRLALLAVGIAAAVPALIALSRARSRAAQVVVVVLAIELLVSAVYSQTYRGGTSFLGLEHIAYPVTPQILASGGAGGAQASTAFEEFQRFQPMRWPDVPVADYTRPGPLAAAIRAHPGRYLSWTPPQAFYYKGYLFSQAPDQWPTLESGRGMTLGLQDALGYSPFQLTRYWTYIRATNHEPLFYTASVIREPSSTDLSLLGVRYLIAPTALPPPVPARPVHSEGPYSLYQVRGWAPLVSVVGRWRVVASGGPALHGVLQPTFDPAREAIVQGNPGIRPGGASGGRATWTESSPERLRIDVRTRSPSLVLVRNAFDSSWAATVDGHRAPVLAADYLLQAVPVSAGHHVVELTYRDPNIGRGLAASGVVWGLLCVAVAVALAVEARRRRRAGPDPERALHEPRDQSEAPVSGVAR